MQEWPAALPALSEAGLAGGLGREQCHAQTVPQLLVYRRAQDDVRPFAVAANLVHDAIHFGQGETGSAANTDQHPARVSQGGPAVDQGMSHELLVHFARAVLATRLSRGQRALRVPAL